MSELESGFRIGDVIAMVRRQWPVVVGASLVGLIAAYLVFSGASTTYSATSRVQVRPIKLDQFATEARTEEVDIATEKDLVKSDAVAEAVRDELGLEGDNRAILTRVTVATEIDSLVLKIDFAGDTAKQSQLGADAVAEAYLAERQATAATTRDTAVERLDAEISAASQALNEAQALAAAAPDGSATDAQAKAAASAAQSDLTALQAQRSELAQFDPATVGDLVRKASLPAGTTSKKDLGLAVGVFGLFVLAGLGAAWVLDHRDALGGGRRRIEQVLPDATTRVMPGAGGTGASPAEIDTAIDRMAVELVAGGGPGRAAATMVVGSGMEPPVALAEELASSLAFAGIPALFILAGSSDREVRSAQTVGSFADLVTSSGTLTGPAPLPAEAGETSVGAAPLVTWLRPRGSAEAAGLLRKAVVDALVARAGRERFEAVVFVAASPTRTAAATALGQWVSRTALVIDAEQSAQGEAAASALADAGVAVAEVVWT